MSDPREPIPEEDMPTLIITLDTGHKMCFPGGQVFTPDEWAVFIEVHPEYKRDQSKIGV